MNKLLLFTITLLLFTACSKNKEKTVKEPKAKAISLTSIDSKSNDTLFFSDIMWRISETEGSVNDEIIPSKADNVFLDSLGRLHLRMTKQSGGFYGAEITADTLFDLGKFSFEIASNLAKLPKNAELRFRLINPNKLIKNGLVETGISIGYENSDKASPIKYYSINTNSKEIEKVYSEKAFVNKNVKFRIIMVKDAVSYVFSANNKNIEEITNSKYTKNSSLTFFAPSTKQKLIISAYYFDGSEKAEEFEVIISKVKTKSILETQDNLITKK